MRPYIIGISGGSGSGKTTLVNNIIEKFGEDDILVIKQDNYYKDQSNLTLEQRYETNYDHPDSFESTLLISDIKKLLNNENVMMPQYDFVEHNRSKTSIKLTSKKIIIIEGILSFHESELRKLMDLKIFVDCDLDTMFIRRLQRDIVSRGRTMDGVIAQYQKTVKPMYYKFIKPTKRFADLIVPNHNEFEKAKELICLQINSIIK